MSSLARVLVVLLTLCSLSFMGFAAVILVGGPSWPAELRAHEEVALSTTTNEEGITTYSASTITGENIASSQNPADVLIKVRSRLTSDAQQEIQKIDQELPLVQGRLDRAKQFIERDAAAIAERHDEVRQQIQARSQQASRNTQEAVAQTTAAQAVRREAEDYRQEAARLQVELEAIRTDTFQARQQRRILEDELVRAQTLLARLERRQKQLRGEPDVSDYDEQPVAPMPQDNGAPQTE